VRRYIENSLDQSEYPATVQECIDDSIKYRKGVIPAVKRYAESKPWKGTIRERKAKMRTLVRDLAKVYRVECATLTFGRIDGSSSGDSYYDRYDHIIRIEGKLSVVTLLHEFGHSLGKGERRTCIWSLNLFKRCFPSQFSKLNAENHLLIR